MTRKTHFHTGTNKYNDGKNTSYDSENTFHTETSKFYDGKNTFHIEFSFEV
jgi:hypothetical protein